MAEKWLTVKEAAKALTSTGKKISATTIRDMCVAGKVPRAKKQDAPTRTGYYWMIPESSLSKIERKTVGKPRSDKPSDAAIAKRKEREKKQQNNA